MPCYILKHYFWQKTQKKAFRPALCAFLDKLEVFLEVVGHRREVHAFVGLFNANGIDLAKPHKLLEGSKDRLHGALPFAF